MHSGQPVSRLLSPLRGGDHLSAPCVAARGQAAHPALSVVRVAPMRLLGLAPGGVCRAAHIAAGAGGLLHRRFTLAALIGAGDFNTS
jgi:hypothetical protein